MMEKYIYTVAKIRNREDEDKVVSIIKSCVDVEEIETSQRTSSIRITVNKNLYKKEELEQKISYALMCQGYELILPEGVATFVPVKDKRKGPRTVSVATAVILAVAVGLFGVMMTFGVCSRYMARKNNDNIPEHIKELMELDEFFRKYSYDGITDEKFGEHLIDAYIQYSGDIYARYYTPEELEALEQDKTGEYVGIGISVKKVTLSETGDIGMEITSVNEKSPAQEAGLKMGDIITHVGGSDSRKSVTELGYNEALEVLAGEAGTFAEFSARVSSDDGTYEDKSFKIERKKVVSISVKGEVCSTDTTVGIITIKEFDYTTPTQFCNAVDTLKEKGCNSFVIDLRDNPGGYVESIASVLSYFLNEGDVIMTTEDRNGKVDSTEKVKVRENKYFSIKKEDIGKYKDLKFSVLVNGNTASAAELFTATVRDYKLGEIVGVKTFGKGCMQRTYMLDDYGLEGALKITTHLYFSKSHESYHGKGIVPDHVIELSAEASRISGSIPHELDNQLQKAIKILK